MQVTKLPYSIITSGQRNLAKRLHCITASHGRLNRIRQVASMWTPSNIRFLQPTRVPCPKRHLDGFNRFCTAHSKDSLYFTTSHPFLPLKIAPLHGEIWTLGPTRVHNQMASWSVEPFLHSSWKTALKFYNWPPIPLSKLPPHRGI